MKMIGPEWNVIHWNKQKVDVRKSLKVTGKKETIMFLNKITLWKRLADRQEVKGKVWPNKFTFWSVVLKKTWQNPTHPYKYTFVGLCLALVLCQHFSSSGLKDTMELRVLFPSIKAACYVSGQEAENQE